MTLTAEGFRGSSLGGLSNHPRVRPLDALKAHNCRASPSGYYLGRGVIRLELTKSGRRREARLNDDSYSGLTEKDSLRARGLKSPCLDGVRSAQTTGLASGFLAAGLTLHRERSGPASATKAVDLKWGWRCSPVSRHHSITLTAAVHAVSLSEVEVVTGMGHP